VGCVADYEQALGIAEKIGDQQGAAACAFSLGHAFKNIPALRNLSRAEEWYQRSLGTQAPDDRMGQGMCMNQLGMVERGRLEEAINAKSPEQALVHFQAGVDWFKRALERIPLDALVTRAIANNQLGVIHGIIQDLSTALPYYREGVRCYESTGDQFNAGQLRFNVAIDLTKAKLFSEALEWARAARRSFEASENADDRIVQTTELIRRIESDLSKNPPPQ
jgi:tetratricopeptide (TPR) repeat protein